MDPVVEKVETISDKLILGEGPHWDAETQSLYFVDIFNNAIHRYVPATKEHYKVKLDSNVSIVVPVKNHKNKFVVTLERKVAVITWDGKSQTVSNWEEICELDKGLVGHRINDGKCDITGRLWTGTMGPEPQLGHCENNKGTLFSLNATKTLTSHLGGIGISNGLAWSLDNKKMYYIDSLKESVSQFDFDVTSGTISNETTIFSFKNAGVKGLPDGMTIDTNGNLWVACFSGYQVIQIDPRKTDTLLRSVKLPAKQVTSVAFGGKNLDELYVTTASFTIDDVVLSGPEHGAIYKITGLGVKGLPADDFVFN